MNPLPIEDAAAFRERLLNQYVDHLQTTTDSLWELSNGVVQTSQGLEDKDWRCWPELPYETDLDAMDETLFCDLYSGEFFLASIPLVQQAMYHLNRNISLQSYAMVDEWFDFLGIDPQVSNPGLGWSQEYLIEVQGTIWLDFFVQHLVTGDGEPYTAIAFQADPIPFEDEGY